MNRLFHQYKMLSTKDDSQAPGPHVIETDADYNEQHGSAIGEIRSPAFRSKISGFLDRNSYSGSLVFNLPAFTLPALYSTLSKLWVAKIDSSQVVTTDVYTYIGVIVEVLNEGLPRTAWLIIGDKSTRTIPSRISLAYTLILFQATFGALLTVIFITCSTRLAAAFVPVEVRLTSLTYVRISSVSALSSAIETAVASSTRSLDHPDVPLLISSVKFLVNIVLDLLLISRFHVGSFTPTINTQALVRMTCDLTSAIAGLCYFLYIAQKMLRSSSSNNETARPAISGLRTLVRPGIYTFAETALRNAIYLWLITGIVDMGTDYATAWGVFNTIRWGVVMVPVQSLEASTLAFVGHAWGTWRASIGPEVRRPKAERRDLMTIARPAFVSATIALVVEVLFCIFLSIWGIKGFAHYLSESNTASEITQKMWKTIDWTYIFYAVQDQLSCILLATVPRYYFFQSLGSNLLWMLPWAIAVTRIGMTPQNAWTYHSIIFGGALVFDFGCVLLMCAMWAWKLHRGRIRLPPVRQEI